MKPSRIKEGRPLLLFEHVGGRGPGRRMREEEFPLDAYHGDCSPLDPEALRHVREVMASEMSPFRWQACDLLVLDNVLAAHGRMAFEGARRILPAMK